MLVIGHELHEADVADFGEQLESLGVQKIADQNGSGVAPDIVGRGLAPADEGLVDDVVVQEARGVDEFNGGRQRKPVLSRIAAQPRADQV
jgi:hypothetical protein